jgi:hypothetical protein
MAPWNLAEHGDGPERAWDDTRRFKSHGRPGLAARFRELDTRTSDYRASFSRSGPTCG